MLSCTCQKGLQFEVQTSIPNFLFGVWPIICSIIINVQLQIFIQSDIWMVECLMWMNCSSGKNNLNEATFSHHKTFIQLCVPFQMSEWILLFQGSSFLRLPLCSTGHCILVMMFFTQMRPKIGLILSSHFSEMVRRSSQIPLQFQQQRCQIWAPVKTF